MRFPKSKMALRSPENPSSMLVLIFNEQDRQAFASHSHTLLQTKTTMRPGNHAGAWSNLA
jgi:hypothetical protein